MSKAADWLRKYIWRPIIKSGEKPDSDDTGLPEIGELPDELPPLE